MNKMNKGTDKLDEAIMVAGVCSVLCIHTSHVNCWEPLLMQWDFIADLEQLALFGLGCP